MKGANAIPSFSRVVRVGIGSLVLTASVRHVPPVGTSRAVSLRVVTVRAGTSTGWAT
jgi:hypothetical protein